VKFKDEPAWVRAHLIFFWDLPRTIIVVCAAVESALIDRELKRVVSGVHIWRWAAYWRVMAIVGDKRRQAGIVALL
jgi:hypothetical protein